MLLTTLLATTMVASVQPNVVLFVVDDLGWQDTSLKFGLTEKMTGRHFRTPNLEKLAKRGVTVNQAYSSCTVCTPSRVALLTGVSPARNHITSWVSAGNDTESVFPGLVSPIWNAKGFQPGDAPTLPELFRNAGYRTMHVGKAHFGSRNTAGSNPTQIGFDKTIAGNSAGHPNSYYGLENFAAKKKNPTDPIAPNDVRDLETYHGKDIFLEEALALEGRKMIRDAVAEKKPLFLWFAPYGVHTPIMPNKRLLSRYKGLDPREAAYATLVESVDNALGSLVAELEKTNQLDNTIILFTSDNGGLSMSSRGPYLNQHNLPLRSGKGSSYEGGTRVPFVIAGPGIAQGKVLAKTAMQGADVFSTLPALAGFNVSQNDGVSHALALQTGEDKLRTEPLVWHFPHYRGGGGPGLEPHSSIRMGDFKAIFFYSSRHWELYNLANDIGETSNLRERNRPKMQELSARLISELTRLGAQFPTDAKTEELVKPTPVAESVQMLPILIKPSG